MQMVNAREGLELAKHHFATIIVKIGSGKNHQWMLNLGDLFDDDQDIFIVQVFPTDCLLVARAKILFLETSDNT